MVRLLNDCCWMRFTLPKAPSLNTTATTPIPCWAAVAISIAVNMNPPSPLIDSTALSGLAILAPSEVA